jgi:hypothetical protein
MPLIDAVFSLVNKKLIGNGWDKLLVKVAGLKLKQPTKAKLAKELDRPLRRVDRTLAGFEDFALAGNRGIQAGSPARSLLYHALASPNVLKSRDGSRLGYFPMLKDLEDVENYVFGVKPPTIGELLTRAGAEQLAVVVFAYEYRPAPQTCHGIHADMVYARTGVARVGTSAAEYHSDLRGFLPESPGDATAICVSPARFAAYLAVQMKGSKSESRPMRIRLNKKRIDGDPPGWRPDDKRDFWVPVQKLFAGKECLRDVEVEDVALDARIVNEKLYRTHLYALGEKRPPTTPPYRFTEGIAAMSEDPTHGTGVLVPDPHPLVAEARIGQNPTGKLVTFTVPRGNNSGSFDTFQARSAKAPNATGNDGEFRNSPEYVHIRTKVDGTVTTNLNDLPDKALTKQLNLGGYEALHYVDFSGDGWVEAVVKSPGLAKDARVTLESQPAYALVTAPDFFPSCDQRELTEWTAGNAVPKSLKDHLWNITPDSLCDQRLAPNIQLDGHLFQTDDFTMTALVSLATSAPTGARVPTAAAPRHSHLPDDAAGVFAPGWDVTRDWTRLEDGKIVWHLAAYGLGSPFPEDAKLCAALSTFWPAVAPDATREMEPVTGNQSGTVAPLTDQEIGQIGDMPWDGVAGPTVVTVDGQEYAEYASFRHVDFVRNAMDGKLTLKLTARVDSIEYENRAFAAALAHLALGAEKKHPPAPIKPGNLSRERPTWKMLSFQQAAHGAPEMEQARQQAGITLRGNVYRMEFFPDDEVEDVPQNFQRKRIAMKKRYFLFVSPDSREVAIRERSDVTWHKGLLDPGL